MRGQILGYSAAKGEGVISGLDGYRYSFKGTDYRGDVLRIRPGTTVDFVIPSDGVATDIYLLSPASSGGLPRNVIAGLLGIFLGGLGIHKFYLGYTSAAVIMLICGTIGWILILPGLAVWLIGFIEGILYLTKSEDAFDAEYVRGEKHWL